jgi:hypothetical protein
LANGATNNGLRLVSVDRPGIGRSTLQKDRSYESWANDLLTIADVCKQLLGHCGGRHHVIHQPGGDRIIVLDDKDGAVLSSANTYQIIGNVTSGMETADAIFAASGGVEQPTNPVPITTATVANP